MDLSGGFLQRPVSLLVAICVTVMPFAVSKPISAQDGVNPNDIWYRGFLLVQASKELEERGKYLEALNKLNDARPLYMELAQNFPNFQPEMIRNRQHLIAESRDKLRGLMRNRPSVSSPNQRNAGTGSTAVSGNPPGEFDNVSPNYGSRSGETEILTQEGEFALPEWNGNDGTNQDFNNRPGHGQPHIIGRPPTSGSHAIDILNDQEDKDRLIDWLNKENQKLKDNEAKLKTELRVTRDQAQRESLKVAQLEKEMSDAKNNPDLAQKLAAVTAMYEKAVDGWKAANALNEKLVSQNAELQTKMKKTVARMAEVERERDSLLEIVNGKGSGGKALKELMERNQQLTEQLDRAEQLASSLSESNREKDQDIAMLKSEIGKVKAERDQLLAENVTHQQNIDRLRNKLQLLSDGLTAEEKNSLTQANPVEAQENELLRSLVLKQLRRQAQMKEAKELLLRQLDKVGSRSDVLLGIVEDMANGPQLTAEEIALFRSPQFSEIVDAATDVAEDVENGNTGETKNSVSGTLLGPGKDGDVTGVIKDQKVTVELEQLEKSARLDFKEGRYSEAESGFLSYLRLRPRSIPCLCNLGVLKISMKNFTEAEHYLEKALAIDSGSGLAHYLLGRTFFLQGKLDEALSSLEQGISRDPGNAKAHNCVGVISSRKGWVTRAEKAFNEAVTLDPKYGDAHFNLAILYATKDQPNAQKVEQHYRKATDLGIPRDAAIEDFLDSEQIPVTVGMR